MFNLSRTQWIALILAGLWFTIFLNQANPFDLITEFGGFTLLGIIGAIFANATGAGGGVVFVPFFNQLGFTPENIIGTSLGIQCCGMTAGALTWWKFFRSQQPEQDHWQALPKALLICVPTSTLGLMTVQYAQDNISILHQINQRTDLLHLGFGGFSILLGVAIFASIPLLNRSKNTIKLAGIDRVSLALISYLGGMITAWLSVGVGELVAVYLIIRGFNVTMSIAVAVILTAFSVWSGIVYHALLLDSVIWPIVLFAGMGAIIGGTLAKHVVLAFSPSKLKIFFGTWVLLLGVVSLPI